VGQEIADKQKYILVQFFFQVINVLAL